MDRFVVLMTLVAALVWGSTLVRAEEPRGVGFTRFDVADPVTSKPMDVVAFYPSMTTNEVTSIGPYDIAATYWIGIASGRYPLVAISHGSSGSLWGYHDLASFLARTGYIVVALTHPGDNYQDSSGVGAVSTIYGRPLQISAVLTAALQNSLLVPHIDERRIGFIGFSAGGQTGLLLAGAKPDLHRLEAYCRSRADDVMVCEAKGKTRNDRPDVVPVPDSRIGAFVLLAPLSVTFSADSLKNVRVPILLYVGGKDEVLSAEKNAIALSQELPVAPGFEIIPDAGHFIFLAPCSDRLARAMPVLCRDAPNVDRQAIHQRMNEEIAGFLAKTFSIGN